MIDPCRDWRGALGAAALGRIDPAEEIGLRAHLDGCAECRAELRELTAVAQALSAVPVESVVGAPAEPSDALAARARAGRARARRAPHPARAGRWPPRRVHERRRRRDRARARVRRIGHGGNPRRAPARRGRAPAPRCAPKPVGTEIDVKVAGLQPGHYYWLWLTGDDEHRLARARSAEGPSRPMSGSPPRCRSRRRDGSG